MRVVGNIASDSEVVASSSGAITAGKPVVVNADGTVSVVSSSPDSLGTEVAVATTDSFWYQAVYDTAQDKVLFIYGGNSNYGTAVVGTVSGTSISFGTPTVFISSNSSYLAAAYDSNAGKTAIFWNDAGDSNQQKAIVATISGTSVSFGSAATFSTNNTGTPAKDATFDSSQNKLLIAYTDGSSSAKVIAGTISGTSISFGTGVEFLSTDSGSIAIEYDVNAGKSLVTYVNSDNSNKIDSKVVSLSGDSVSLGSQTNVYNASADKLAIAYDSTNTKLVATYRPNSGTTLMHFIVATISGTSVSYGTGVSSGVDFNETAPINLFNYNVFANKVIFAGRDDGNSYIQKYVSARVSGTSITMDTPVTYYSNTSDSYVSCSTYDPDQQKSILFYADGTAGPYKNPIARVLTLGSGDNLTSENFIGFAKDAVADGAVATIQSANNIARSVQTPNTSDVLGSETVFETGEVGEGGEGTFATFDSSNNRVVVFYQDVNNSSYGTACVGSVSGSAITFGTPVVIQSANLLAFGATFDSSNNKVVVVYTNQASSEISQASVGTVDPSNNSISFGTAATYDSSSGTSNNAATFDTNSNKVAIVYRDLYSGGGHGKSRVGTVSGTSITFGTEVTFESADTQHIECAFDSSNNKVVVAYHDAGNSSYGTAIVGTISGTDISFGTAVVFESGTTTNVGIVFDSSNNKVIISYRDSSNSGHGTAIVGTVSGTSISFGSAAVFEAAGTEDIAITFDSNVNKAVIAYYDDDDNDYGKYVLGTVSGTSISFTSATTFNAGTTLYNSATFDSNENRSVIFFRDSSDSNKGKGITLAPTGGVLQNLTIGQQYFVQTDATVKETADSPSVVAGTAIGTTDLIVKG